MRKITVSNGFQFYFLNKEKKQGRQNEIRGYKDLKTIMEQREKEEKGQIRKQIREQLKKRTGLSVDTPDLFLTLKRTQKNKVNTSFQITTFSFILCFISKFY